jgi:prolyl oligopeptidase
VLIATDWGPGSLTESGYPFIVKAWKRGTPLSSAQEILRGDQKDVGVFFSSLEDSDGTRAVIATEAQDFFASKHFRVDGDRVTPLPLPSRVELRGLHKGELIFNIQEPWTPPGATAAFDAGALVSLTLATAEAPTPTVRLIYGAGAREAVESVAVAKDAVLALVYRNVRASLVRFSFDGRGWVETEMSLPPGAGAASFAGVSPSESTAFLVARDYLRPDTLVALDARTRSTQVLRSLNPLFDASTLVSEQFEATSKDGTKIPYTIVRRKDLKFDGAAPTLLWGYGGFEVSYPPAYSAFAGKLWMERGGVYVVANIRGGGEFGPKWHQAGLKTNRQVIYDDFIAVAEDLIARKMTSPRRLGIMGGSNGGLLMGAMLTQRPELFRAAVVQVPLLDMLNYANPNMLAGASWVAEYGDPRFGADGKPVAPAERAWLEKLSPYQNLKKRSDFPVPFFVTSTKDDRVHPAHARKYAAKMQKLGMPFFYYENIDGGHAAAANLQEAARRRALEMTYLSQRLMD